MQEELAQGEATSAGKARAGAVTVAVASAVAVAGAGAGAGADAGADAGAGESTQACVPEPGAASPPTITWTADAESTGATAENVSPHRA